jgi:hypothetical protein
MLKVHKFTYDIEGFHDGKTKEDTDSEKFHLRAYHQESNNEFYCSCNQKNPECPPDSASVGLLNDGSIVVVMRCRMIHFYYLDEVEECENKYPNKVYKVPVKANLLHHFVVAGSVVNTNYGIIENDDV